MHNKFHSTFQRFPLWLFPWILSSSLSTLDVFRTFLRRKVKYFNLDAILSLGYRVNSVQATSFRKWATSALKQYMFKGYVDNHNVVSEQKYEDLKRALGLLENVFSQNIIMAEPQANASCRCSLVMPIVWPQRCSRWDSPASRVTQWWGVEFWEERHW